MTREAPEHESPPFNKPTEREGEIATAIRSMSNTVFFLAGAIIFSGTRGDEVIGGSIMAVAALAFVVRVMFSR